MLTMQMNIPEIKIRKKKHIGYWYTFINLAHDTLFLFDARCPYIAGYIGCFNSLVLDKLTFMNL